MAKTDIEKPVASPATAPSFDAAPRMGELITVRVATGVALVNMETGLDFAPEADTLQTVTAVTLRRLADGDLVRVA